MLSSPSTYIQVSGGNISSFVEFVPPGGYPIGSMVPGGTTVTVHYIITSPANLKDTLCFNLHFVDSIAPVINIALESDTVGCAVADYPTWLQAQMDSLTAHQNDFDNCGIDTIYNNGPATFTNNCGTVTVTFYVEDVSGNVDSETASYTTTDPVLPVLIGVPADMIINCDDPIPAMAVVTATDNCAANPTVAFSESSSLSPNTTSCNHYDYTIVRTWSTSDGCGNSVQNSQTINIEDIGLPNFDIPADTVVSCGTPVDTTTLGSYSNVTDNCSAVFTITLANVVNQTCAQERTIQRTWTVTDPCLNSVSKTQTISVVDTVAPTVNFPADLTVDCSDVNDISVTGQPTMISDNCDTSAFYTQLPDTIVAGSCDYSYLIKRPWVVTDACGNYVESLQLITVTDNVNPVANTEAQNQVIVCDDAVNADNVFNAWVANHGGATASDNCTSVADLVWLAYDAGTTTPATLTAPNCVAPISGIYRTRTVDFIVIDKCGNRDTTTATFTVSDATPPVLTDCPTNMLLDTDPGVCEATRTLPLPKLVEECGNTTAAQGFSLTQTLTIPVGMDPVETPVNNVVFNFAVPGPPYTAITNATLKISLNDVDAEAPTEFLMVYGEDGSVLGAVAHTPVQCSDTTTTFTLTAAQVNDWAFDGTLTITVKPNIPVGQPGRFSVNPICPNGSVTADLDYSTDFPGSLRFEYSLNGGSRILVAPVAPVTEVFGQGTTTVTYYFNDCAGNESTCSFDVEVEDNEAPAIACPPGFAVNLGQGECTQDVLVPLFSAVTDNCAVSNSSTQDQPVDSLDRLITFNYNPNLNDFVANDKTFTFSGLQGNASPGGVQLVITLQADVDSSGAYFEIYDNDGNFLGTTAKGQPNVTPGDCNSPSTAVFTIPATTFNDWASAGDIQVTAVSYMNYPIPPAGPGWGINPCNPLAVTANGDTDGSFIFATFNYQSISPVFAATGVTTISPVTLTPPLEAQVYTLAQGTTTFSYQVTDLAGNDGIGTFDVTVQDTEAPVAICGPTFVDINPSGIVTETILPSEIDLGSSDNCTIVSMTVTPNVVTCNDATTNPNPVTLTVTDASGNVSTCTTYVNVSVTTPQPTVTSNCGSSDLLFFANPPATPGGGSNPYQYVWYNPQGLPIAYTENPVILDADQTNLGFYNVVIQGLTGCEAVGAVQVTCDLLPLQKPTVQAVDNIICSSENVQLTTPSVCGTTVVYKWYSGNFPGVLMGTTILPAYSMTPAASGVFTFYVVVQRNGCESTPSDPVTVQVNATPVAMPEQTSIILCEGGPIFLNSINNAPGTTCHWTGPCGYESFNCSPAPIADAIMCNGGIYNLVVTKNGCESAPATVAVTVVAQPVQPSITNSTAANNPACEGETLVLTSTVATGAVSYLWTTPTFTTISTPGNVLTIPDASILLHAGQWTVQAIGNPCESEVSPPTTVYIVPAPEAIAAAATPTPVCEGQDLQLSASSASQNVSFFWNFPNTQTSAQQNPLITNVNNNNEGIYILTVTNQFGCSVSTFVEVSVIDRVDITSVSSDAPPCVGGPVDVHLVATVFPINNGTYQYLWTGPNGYSSVEASATIPNATFANSGAYTLVVTNAQGCVSLPATVNVAVPQVIVTPTPPTGIINPYCEGDNLTITTTAYPGPNVTYIWHTPSGDYTTSTPSLTLTGLTASDAGTYTVNYSVNDCNSGTSGSVGLIVNAAPAIQPSSNSPVCEGQTLQLAVNCTAGAMYEWTGPGGFSSSVCNPVVPNANPSIHAGTYTVRKKVSGCWSEVVPVNVAVNEKPEVPTAVNAGPYCANTDIVMLSVTTNSATPGASYTWYDTNGQPLGTASPSLNFPVPNPTQYGNGTEEFYVIATLNGCASTPSVPTVVLLNTVPSNQAEAGADLVACEGDILTLQATVPTVGTGQWTLVSGNPTGVAIANPDQASTTVSGIVPGQQYVFQWGLSNGACENYSTDEMGVYVDLLEDADAGQPIIACYTSFVNLNAVEPASNIGTWTQPASQASLGVTIVDPSNANTLVSGLVTGNSYIFTWTIDGGCGTSSDAVLVTVTNESAYAGDDFQACGAGIERCTQINAIPALSGVGSWSSPDGGIDFAAPTASNTTACNLQPGQNILVWTTNGGACGHYSVDSVIVNYTVINAGDDFVDVTFAETAFVNVIFNDNVAGAYNINILQQPEHGTLTVGLNGLLTYDVAVNYAGDDVAIYEVCQVGCDCATASIFFNIGEKAGCVVPSIITP
ncbi:MAG: HYR domain-containing protein, partial [Bacteroidetes bacterium]|nr:HYR domain-containing protein [Bacteroidota bacterium]